MIKEFNSHKARIAQRKYCEEKKYPDFAPINTGICYSCRRDIFSEGGISVEEAATEHITGCPFCHHSYCD